VIIICSLSLYLYVDNDTEVEEDEDPQARQDRVLQWCAERALGGVRCTERDLRAENESNDKRAAWRRWALAEHECEEPEFAEHESSAVRAAWRRWELAEHECDEPEFAEHKSSAVKVYV
jgi:hypothetical protein